MQRNACSSGISGFTILEAVITLSLIAILSAPVGVYFAKLDLTGGEMDGVRRSVMAEVIHARHRAQLGDETTLVISQKGTTASDGRTMTLDTPKLSPAGTTLVFNERGECTSCSGGTVITVTLSDGSTGRLKVYPTGYVGELE